MQLKKDPSQHSESTIDTSTSDPTQHHDSTDTTTTFPQASSSVTTFPETSFRPQPTDNHQIPLVGEVRTDGQTQTDADGPPRSQEATVRRREAGRPTGTEDIPVTPQVCSPPEEVPIGAQACTADAGALYSIAGCNLRVRSSPSEEVSGWWTGVEVLCFPGIGRTTLTVRGGLTVE